MDNAVLRQKSRQHITFDVRYQVRPCPECGVDYYVAQPGPSGVIKIASRIESDAEDSHLSVGVMEVAPSVSLHVSGLMELDRQLRKRDARAPSELDQMQRVSEVEWQEHADRLFWSYLWVLGAYEVIRTVHAALRGSPGPAATDCAASVRSAKRLLERVPGPLARGEPRRGSHGFALAAPALVPGVGIAWTIAPDDTVSRHELADAFP